MQSGQEVIELHLDDIIPNRFQPREVFDERALKELAASIKEHGVIQPIIVRQVNNKYEIIAGERRYKASALAGMTKIPAIINNLDDKEAAKVALLENLQRKNLNPIEEARTYQKILELDQMTQESLAKTMGKSQSAVANKLRLLSLSDEIQLSLLKEEISERHARALLNVDDHEKQKELLNRIINEKMSVRNLEEEIKKINHVQSESKEGVEMNNNSVNLEQIMPTSQNVEKPNLMESFINNNDDASVDNNVMIPETNNQNNNNVFNVDNNNAINYGNIDEDEIQNENINFDNNLQTSAGQTIDLDEMKSSTVDIDQIIKEQQQVPTQDNKEKISNDLDSLLNIKAPENSGFKSINELVKANEDKSNELNKDDYFQEPDLMSIQLPTSTNNIASITNSMPKNQDSNEPRQQNNKNNDQNNNSNEKISLNNMYNRSFFNNKQQDEVQNINQNNNKTLGMALMEETYNLPKQSNQNNNRLNINQIIEQIRKTIQMLERNGAKIDTDEIDFENQYQIVIRIDKNN